MVHVMFYKKKRFKVGFERVQSFFWQGRGKSFHVEGPNMEKAQEPTVASCYGHLHQSLNNLFRKFSRRLSPNHAILIPFLQNCCTKTLMFSCLQSPTSSTLHWLLVLYHQTSKLLLSNPCSKNPPSIITYWKTTIQSQTCHFCLKFLKRSFYTNFLLPRKQPLQSFPISLPHQTQYQDCTPMRCKWLVKRYGWRQNLCFTLTGSFSCVWHYWSPDSSFLSRNCFWHLLYRSPVVSIITSGQKSMRCCQQFCFLFFSSHVWCSTGFSVGTCAVCFVHYSTFRHHSQSLSQPSASCRRHPTSKINSTKQRAKPYTRPAIMYRRHKSMDVQQPTQT